MKGNLEHLLRERFQGHEAPVDPGVWDAIQGQLTQAAPAADAVNDLFRERFAGHEAPVDPAVWQGVSKQLGHAPAGNGTWGWAAAVGGVVLVGALAWFMNDTPLDDRSPDLEQASVPVTVPSVNEIAPVETEVLDIQQDTKPAAPVAPSAGAKTFPASTRGQQNAAAPAHGPTAPVVLAPSTASSPVQVKSSEGAAPAVAPQLVQEILQEITDRTVQEVQAERQRSVTTPQVVEADPVVSEQGQPSLPLVNEAPEIFMPNTFTPNGDQINDTYAIATEGFARMTMRVVALSNDKLVFSTATGEAWTGDGCADGMYVVVVEAITPEGEAVSKAKVVWLNRNPMN